MLSTRRTLLIVLHCSIAILFSASNAVCQDYFGSKDWLKIESKYLIVKYQTPEHLKLFSEKIDYQSGEWYLDKLSSLKKEESFQTDLIKNLDSLFERVQQILDMRKRMEKVTVLIFKDQKELDDVYKEIYNKSSSLRAWYSYNFNSIFVNLEDIHEGMLGHELAHAIIDHYLEVRPPKASAEILARYVDTHLNE